MRLKSITAFILLFILGQLYSQDLTKIIDINPRVNGPNESLPFDKPFVLRYLFGEKVTFDFVGLFPIPKKKVKDYYNNLFTDESIFRHPQDAKKLTYQFYYNSSGSGDNKWELIIFVPPLEPNSFYDIVLLRHPTSQEAEEYFDLFKILSDNGGTINLPFRKKLVQINILQKPFIHVNDDGTLRTAPLLYFYSANLTAYYASYAAAAADAEKQKIKSQIINTIKDYEFAFMEPHLFEFGQSLSLTTTFMNFDTRTGFKITPDFGYVYYGWQKKFNGIAPYIGFEIEFRYFNKDIPFRLINNKSILHYLSFTTALTLTSLKKENKREDLFSNKSLLAGLGFRLSNALRITGGVILFNKEDPNPYRDNKQLGITPYAGLSIDLRLKSLINDFYSLPFVNRK